MKPRRIGVVVLVTALAMAGATILSRPQQPAVLYAGLPGAGIATLSLPMPPRAIAAPPRWDLIFGTSVSLLLLILVATGIHNAIILRMILSAMPRSPESMDPEILEARRELEAYLTGPPAKE